MLNDILELGEGWSRFLGQALWFYMKGRGLDWNNEEEKQNAENELQSIFWGEPRPLISEAIPTLLRKLETNWKKTGSAGASIEDSSAKRPMPKSVPGATFQELVSNEGRVLLESFRGQEREDESLSIQQFMRETCPGNVSKRFSVNSYGRAESGFWHELSPALKSGANKVALDEIYPETIVVGMVGNTAIYQPTIGALIHVDNSILESSSSTWVWESSAEVINPGDTEKLPMYVHSFWNDIFSDSEAILHRNGSWVELTRFAHEAEFEVRARGGSAIRGVIALEEAEQNSNAVGFQIQTDALRFLIKRSLIDELITEKFEMDSKFRSEYFSYQMENSETLKSKMNFFMVRWMIEISMATLCAAAMKKGITLEEAQRELTDKRVGAANKVMETIFQVVDASPEQGDESRLKKNIRELWSDESIVKEISVLEETLWNFGFDHKFENWLKKRLISAIAQALRLAVSQLSEQFSEGDILVDVIGAEENYEIYLTEQSSGGLGHIELAVSEIKQDPRFFLMALEHSLADCTRETWATELVSVVNHIATEHRVGGGDLSDSFDKVRSADNLKSTQKAMSALVEGLRNKGLNCRRGNISAVNMKILRPGSTVKTDLLTHSLGELWKRHSERLGLKIPIKTFAYVACNYAPSVRRLTRVFRDEFSKEPSSGQLFSIVQQLLFEGCDDSCPDCLNNPNYFNDFGKPDRNLARQALSLDFIQIEMKEGWVSEARQLLAKHGEVSIVTEKQINDSVIMELVETFFSELNLADYQESILISGVKRNKGHFEFTLRVRNFHHVKP